MKNTLSLWTAVMVLVCVSLQVSALPYSDTRVLQDNRLLSLKRTKPSLSIVNPLDVLRQRIILEMARRQMRENTRQVELNKALLREIGKRSSNMYDGGEYPPNYSSYDRKAYSQRIAADPVRGRTQATDELDAMVEAFMRYNQLAAQDRKPHRAHTANDRSSLSGNENGILTGQPQPDAEPSQRQTLHGHFNNEQDDLKTKEQALRQSLAAGQEQQDSTDENGVNDEQDEEPVSGSNGALETNQQTPNERTTGGEFGPRYVYGMYKSRYAN